MISLRTIGVLLIVVATQFGLAVLSPGFAHDPDKPAARLPMIGPAVDFTLTAQDGTTFSMADLRGKVVALSFIFTRCSDVCPIATQKMVRIQQELGEQFGRDVYFLSVSVDPEHDTPNVLADYAEAFGCDTSGWVFLTGSAAEIRDVARGYGVFHQQDSGEEVRHNLLTSLIDRDGMLRVQYMGERFDPQELLHDLRDLLAVDATP